MPARVACVVEGHGERDAVPVLLRRIAQRVAADAELQIARPIRVPRSKLLKAGELDGRDIAGIGVTLDLPKKDAGQIGGHRGGACGH